MRSSVEVKSRWKLIIPLAIMWNRIPKGISSLLVVPSPASLFALEWAKISFCPGIHMTQTLHILVSFSNVCYTFILSLDGHLSESILMSAIWRWMFHIAYTAGCIVKNSHLKKAEVVYKPYRPKALNICLTHRSVKLEVLSEDLYRIAYKVRSPLDRGQRILLWILIVKVYKQYAQKSQNH